MKNAMILFLLLAPLVVGQHGYALTVEKIEYFIDTDPGTGQASPVTITAGESVSADFTVDLNTVSDGFHVLYIRAMQKDKDNNDVWSITYSRPFFKADISASNISKMEYWIDTEPGFGKGVDIPITEGASVSQTFSVNLTDASSGFHVLYIRTQNKNGNWSLTHARPFFKNETDGSSTVTKLEYWIDEDPGFGNGTDIPITQSASIIKDFSGNLTAIAPGFHILYVRAKDINGIWSLSYSLPFIKIEAAASETPPDIEKMEYYIDADPGLEKGVNIPVTTGSDQTKGFIVDVSAAEFGFHVLYVRAKDKNGNWSMTYTRPFFKTENTDVTEMEYFMDSDPGYGKGVVVPITPGSNITKDFSGDLTALDVGSVHSLYVRVKGENGLWSEPVKVDYSVQPYNLADVIILLNLLTNNPPSWWEAKHTALADKVKDGVLDLKDVISITQYLTAQ